MRIHRDESGQVLALTGFCMVVLLGFMALALDVGMLFRAKRNLQIAADAAAIAAATYERYYPSGGGPSSITGAALAASALNGVTNGSGGAVVTVVTPPVDGSVTSTGFIEVTVSKPASTYFMGVLTRNSSMTVAARAVAGVPAVGSSCIYITGYQNGVANQADALVLHGSGSINAPNCGVYVNSSSNSALDYHDGGVSLTALTVSSYGGVSGTAQPTSATAHAPAQSDPLGNLTGPTLSACTTNNTVTATTVTTALLAAAPPLNGVVCFNPSSGNTTTLSGGLQLYVAGADTVYLFEQNVSIGVGSTVQFGNGSCTGSGSSSVCTTSAGGTMDLYAGTLSQASNNLLTIYAPTTTGNIYNGVAILQPMSNTNALQVQFGSNNQVLDGWIYAPGAAVTLHDQGGGLTASGIVAGTLYDNSAINIFSYNKANQYTTPFRAVTLVE